jgi:hypothetical protein
MRAPATLAAVAIAFAFSLPAHAGTTPFGSAQAGVITLSFEDTDPNDGIAAGASLARAASLTAVVYEWHSFVLLTPLGNTSEMVEVGTVTLDPSRPDLGFTGFGLSATGAGALGAYASTDDLEIAPRSGVEIASRARIQDNWVLSLAPHTHAVLSFLAQAAFLPTHGSATVRGFLTLPGGESIMQSIDGGSRLLSFEATSGASDVTAAFGRQLEVAAFRPVQAVSPIPEPQTYLLMLCGLALLGRVASNRRG